MQPPSEPVVEQSVVQPQAVAEEQPGEPAQKPPAPAPAAAVERVAPPPRAPPAETPSAAPSLPRVAPEAAPKSSQHTAGPVGSRWAVGSGDAPQAYNPALVERLYTAELGACAGGAGVSELERSQARGALSSLLAPATDVRLWCLQYLEGYLQPHLREGVSKAHVLSMVLLVNEKVKESLPPWACFPDSTTFSVFFKRRAPVLARAVAARQ